MIKTAISLVLFIIFLHGCMSLGVQKMTPEQIKATDGLLTCDNIFSIYARGNSASVNLDAVKKGITSGTKIKVGAGCEIEISTESTAVTPTVQPAAKP